MAYNLEIQFFNTFVLKLESGAALHVEESRIKGGYNEPFATLGPKAYLSDENYAENRRSNALIYSGIYNSRTDVNQTNVFSVAENITKAVDPSNGSIQKLHAEDTNLNIFQEEKVSYALIDKDALFTAEGGQLTASGAKIIGQIIPYLGNYGISKNPESFAIKGIRKYFTDKNKGLVLRLSRDGITEISQYGMKNFFKTNLKNAVDVVGMHDDHFDEYVVSIKKPEGGYDTLAFDESIKGWVSFYSYNPKFGFSMNKSFYTFNDNANLFEHYTSSNYNNFYNFTTNSNITIVANTDPSVVKTFHTINYEGSPGWQMTESITDLGMYAKPVLLSTTAVSPGSIPVNFIKKENKYYAHLRNSDKDYSPIPQDLPSVSGQIVGMEVSGIKGFFTTVKMEDINSSTAVELFNISHNVSKSS
jgi:hypothetical protein